MKNPVAPADLPRLVEIVFATLTGLGTSSVQAPAEALIPAVNPRRSVMADYIVCLEDGKKFKERADCIVQEYGAFKATADTNLNGKRTLGENGADNGGVRLAFMALMDAIAKLDAAGGKSMPAVADYTPQQRFFLAYGQVWCQNISEEAARLRAVTDPHSLGRYRVNGVVQNMPEFQKAFGCQVGQPMVSEKGCRIW